MSERLAEDISERVMCIISCAYEMQMATYGRTGKQLISLLSRGGETLSLEIFLRQYSHEPIDHVSVSIP